MAVTREDVDNYGRDLVDFSQRAAVHAVGPHLVELERSNAELRDRLAREARARLDERVESAVPNYREIDSDPAWHEFLRTVEPMAGRIRQVLLNDAIAQGDAARVIAFFHGFERSRSSQSAPSAQQHRASPSRASTRPTPNGPIYTRAQITKLYDQHRRGAYVGREAEWAKLEFDIIRAGAEGRIAGGVDLHGK